MLTTEVENFPGFPDGVMGPTLMGQMRAQAERFGARFVDENASRVDLSHRPFHVETGAGTNILADTLIIATGANARWLGLPSEKRLQGHGVSACATCDGFFFKDRDVITVGGGDTAMEEALFLTRFARHVTIVHRRGELRASRIMQARARANPKISFRLECTIEEVLGEGQVTGLKVRHGPSGKVETIAAQGLFVAIGHDPATELFKGQIDLTREGYIMTHGETRTSVPGVFVAGDVHDHRYRQAVTAAGLGCMASIDAERFLEERAAEAAAPPVSPPASRA